MVALRDEDTAEPLSAIVTSGPWLHRTFLEFFLCVLLVCFCSGPVVSFIRKCLQSLGRLPFQQPVQIDMGVGHGSSRLGTKCIESLSPSQCSAPLDSCCPLTCRIPSTLELPGLEVFPRKNCSSQGAGPVCACVYS